MSASSNPRFSIVIPTRERANTLEFALRTCLAQRYDDYEIVVCDNCSSPATRQVVERFGSPKIEYVRSDKPLAMSDNWDLAVSRARGEFVTIIGDDDGLMFHTLSEADRLITQMQVKALRWDWVYYDWPNPAVPARSSRLRIPLARRNRVLSSDEILGAAAVADAPTPMLPMIYNSMIHQDLVRELRRRTGRVFKGITPDVYSGFAFAQLARNYGSAGRPMAINGVSPKSNALAQFFGPESSPIVAEFDGLNEQAGLAWHPRVPHVPRSMTAVVAESLERTNENLFVNGAGIGIDRRMLAEAIIRDLSQLDTVRSQDWDEAISAVDSSFSEETDLRRWFASACSDARSSRGWTGRWPRSFEVFTVLDASPLGVNDSFGLAQWLDKNFNWRGSAWRLRTQMQLMVLRQKGLANCLKSMRSLIPLRRIRVAFRDKGFRNGFRAVRDEWSNR